MLARRPGGGRRDLSRLSYPSAAHVLRYRRCEAPAVEPSKGADRLAASCDVIVKIPMRGRADSLNLAIATGIMVYAATEGT